MRIVQRPQKLHDPFCSLSIGRGDFAVRPTGNGRRCKPGMLVIGGEQDFPSLLPTRRSTAFASGDDDRRSVSVVYGGQIVLVWVFDV